MINIFIILNFIQIKWLLQKNQRNSNSLTMKYSKHLVLARLEELSLLGTKLPINMLLSNNSKRLKLSGLNKLIMLSMKTQFQETFTTLSLLILKGFARIPGICILSLNLSLEENFLHILEVLEDQNQIMQGIILINEILWSISSFYV